MMPLRKSLSQPIDEIYVAADMLTRAVDAHLQGSAAVAEELFKAADKNEIRSYTESVWGAGAKERFGFVAIKGAPIYLSKIDRPVPRMPDRVTCRQVIERDGYHCRFCGIPVIAPETRRRIQRAYPDAVQWGTTNQTQHAAFQCMWLQFDHVLPNSRGGSSSLDNIVVTCAPCNFGRMETTLEEASLFDPRSAKMADTWTGYSCWDGLNRFR